MNQLIPLLSHQVNTMSRFILHTIIGVCAFNFSLLSAQVLRYPLEFFTCLGLVILLVMYLSDRIQFIPTPLSLQQPMTADLDDKVVTIFYPGLGGSYQQALPYAGPKGFDEMSIPHAPKLLYGLHSTNPPEMTLWTQAPFFARHWNLLLWWPTGIVAMGVLNFVYGVRNSVAYTIDPRKINFAQKHDIKTCYNFIQSTINKPEQSNKKNVLAGTSRGASTILTTLVTYPMLADRVSFVLLDGVFDSVPSIAEARLGKRLGALAAWLMQHFTSYDPTFDSPLVMAERFPTNVPVAFVMSKVDTIVPAANSMRVYDAVIKARGGDKSHVHLCQLETSWHSRGPIDNLADQHKYRGFSDMLHGKYV